MNIAAWKQEVDNGRIPLSKLRAISPPDYDADLQGPAMMHPEAAYNYELMHAAAKADGIDLAISYSYRTYAKQLEKWANYQAGGNVAAQPGASNHGWALALDLNIARISSTDWRPMPGLSAERFNWLKQHAGRYGYHNNDASSEPWHWDYEGGGQEEEDMTAYEDFKTGVRLKKDGKPLPRNANPDVQFGYNMEERATTLPKPEAGAAHDHDDQYAKKTHPHTVT